MKKLKWLAFSVLAALVLIAAGCGGGDEVSNNNSETGNEESSADQGVTVEKTYEWKLGWNSGLEDTPRGSAAKAFAEHIEKETNGRVTIEFFPNETYAASQEMIEAVQMGALEMQVVGANMVGNIIPQYAALSLPFMTQGAEEAYAVLDGPIGDELKKLGEEHGMKVLGDVDLGFTQITNNVRPIHSPEDLQGVKMRSPNDVSLIETFKAFGASVSTMAYTEIYNGLSQGVIDGQFNPIFHIFDQNMHEVQDYLAITNHTFYYAYIIMNDDLFNSLDPELQQIIVEAGNKGRDAARQFVADTDAELMERAKTEFVEITYPDLEPFQEAVIPVYAKMEDVMGAKIINDMQDFLEDYRKK
jgi:tripartite ATP-independent transporter DctP family solute receptor